jgi:TetR/AcrR family transcriptional repressor of nem operon
MKVSRAQVEDSRRAILEAAARLFRLRGFDDVSVSEIMKAAGLTHGAFYGYFASKEELVTACFAHTFDQVRTESQRPFDVYATDYLSERHRDNRGGGCLFSSLGTEAVRASAETRHVMTGSIKQQIEDLSATAPGATPAERRRAAIAGWSAMVGAVMLSRISDDPALAEEFLIETREALVESLV